MGACCQWCNSIVKEPPDYNRKTTRLYCSKNCLEKDWLFMRWQSDEYLTILAERKRDEL